MSSLVTLNPGRSFLQCPLRVYQALFSSLQVATSSSDQTRFPAIAALARDVLSFPATGAGVERLFNTARDVCHYRRGRIKSETIEELMMFLCTSRFDIEEQKAKLPEKFFSHEEMEAAKEKKDEKLDKVEIDPISDTEEQDTVRDGEVGLDEAGEADEGGEAQLPLPRNTTPRYGPQDGSARFEMMIFLSIIS